MRLTVRLLGTDLISVEVARSQKAATEAAAPEDRGFGFFGGKGPTLSERAPTPTASRRAREKRPLNPS